MNLIKKEWERIKKNEKRVEKGKIIMKFNEEENDK